MIYVQQLKDWGIGNFINCTPTIQMLAEFYKCPISVFFESNVVRDMFLDCNFINILIEEPQIKPLFTSAMVNRNIPDYVYIQNQIKKTLNIKTTKTYHTYVDNVVLEKHISNKPYVVFARGCAGPHWEKAKEPGDDIYIHIAKKVLNHGLDVILIGSNLERDKLERINENINNRGQLILNNVRTSLALINNAEFVVANDTGMYHAAGALNKKTFVIWKDTPFEKNQSPGQYIWYSRKDKWNHDFDLFMKEIV